MRKKIFFALLIIFKCSVLNADTRSSLRLSGVSYSTVRTNIEKFENKHKQYWLLKVFSNQAYEYSRHKIKITGLDQKGLFSKINKLSENNHKIEHELLIDFIKKNTYTSYRPIFLNISAN